jgi:diaminopropionate ammonia-lyase
MDAPLVTGAAVVNADVRLSSVPGPPGQPLWFHRSLPGYLPTPLHDLPALAAEAGVAQVLVKDESVRLGLTSFKVLGASWAIERMLRETPDVVSLVAASAGNHGLAVARNAQERGLDCRIYLPTSTTPSRAAPIAATGARLIYVDGDYDAAVADAANAARTGGVRLVADVSDDPMAETPRWVIDGYSTLLAELPDQLPESVDVIFVPAGVGSLAAAAVAWAGHQTHAPRVIAVEPVTAACVAAALTADRPVRVATPGTTMSGLDCGTVSSVAWPWLRAGLSGAISVTDAAVHQAMRDLADQGLAIGDCGAASLAALRALGSAPWSRPLRDLTGLGTDSRVLLLATEGITDPVSYRQIVTGG